MPTRTCVVTPTWTVAHVEPRVLSEEWGRMSRRVSPLHRSTDTRGTRWGLQWVFVRDGCDRRRTERRLPQETDFLTRPESSPDQTTWFTVPQLWDHVGDLGVGDSRPPPSIFGVRVESPCRAPARSERGFPRDTPLGRCHLLRVPRDDYQRGERVDTKDPSTGSLRWTWV